MAFHAGQKVECIDDVADRWSKQWIKRGTVYVISRVFSIPFGENTDIAHLRCSIAIDLVNVEKPNGFSALRFRPIVERKTDISFAHEILRKAKAPARTLAFASPPGGGAAS